MNHLKIVSKGWAGYSGLIGTTMFKDGISVEPVPQIFADRITGVAKFVEVDAEGNELGAAGAAERLIKISADRAPVRPELPRQSEAERKAEDREMALKSDTAPVEIFYTKTELETIAEKHGIRGLREIAEPWGRKNRSIPALIEEILAAQSEFLAKRATLRAAHVDAAIEGAGEPKSENNGGEPEPEGGEPEPEGEPVDVAALAEKIAAAVTEPAGQQAVLTALAAKTEPPAE